MTVRVLVVDDQQLVREGIAALLGLRDGITVVGTAADGHEAVEKVLALRPDVVLMDVRMPRMDGVEAVAVLRTRAPECRAVMLTTFDDEDLVTEALRAGASGYLLKDLPAARLAEAVRLAHAGVAQLDAQVAARLAARLPRPAAPEPDTAARNKSISPRNGHGAPGTPHLPAEPAPAPGTPPLTPRELEILRLVARGHTNREIAARLYLSEGTVKNHLSRILTRLGLRDRTQAAIHAHDTGLL
ncbi:response regulator [Streptomyces sp. NPDC005017]|uniref:response regulator n=1 Tax=Streptomyces sp. NPDC005017 TaxID=3364706 RepID=UPI00368EC690